MSDDLDDMSDEEKILGLKFLKILYWVIILGLFALIFLQLFAGWKGWTWFLVIPLWGFANLGLRVLKTSVRNIIDDLQEEFLLSLDVSDDSSSDKNSTSRHLTPSTTVLVFLVLLFVSAFWYSLGLGLNFVLSI